MKKHPNDEPVPLHTALWLENHGRIEISARAKLLSVAIAIAEQYGGQESDWDMLHIWRALEYGELNVRKL